MAQRSIRLDLHEHRVMCPHCSALIIYYALPAFLTACQKQCPKCSQDFLVDKGVGKKLKKRPQRADVTYARTKAN